jgi:hypothetical protein
MRTDIELQGLVNYHRYNLKGVSALPELDLAREKLNEINENLIKA